MIALGAIGPLFTFAVPMLTTAPVGADAAVGRVRRVLFRLLLAVPLPGPAHGPVDAGFGDVHLATTAAIGFLADAELHFVLLLLAPLQQAALVVAVLLFHGLQVEVCLDEREHRLVRLVE